MFALLVLVDPPTPPEVPVLVDPTVVTGPTLSMVELAPLLTTLLAGVVIPMLVDLLVASAARPAVKSVVATVASVLAGALSTVAWSQGTSLQVYAVNVAAAFIMAMAAHRAGVSNAIQNKVPGGAFRPGRHARSE